MSNERLVEAAVEKVRDANGYRVVHMPDGLEEEERDKWKAQQRREHPWHHLVIVSHLPVVDGQPVE